MKAFELANIVVLILLVSLSSNPMTYQGSARESQAIRTVNLASDVDWEVYDGDPALGQANLLGNAQHVCLNPLYPLRCPAGATLYDWNAGGWSADLSSIPRANWIWAPKITGQTTPAEFNQFFFSRSFRLVGSSVSGSISIAVDDFAEVHLNGLIIGSTGSIDDFSTAASAQSSLKSFDLTPFLVEGKNIITIRAENGPFGFCCPSSYSGNPAGVVFGGMVYSS